MSGVDYVTAVRGLAVVLPGAELDDGELKYVEFEQASRPGPEWAVNWSDVFFSDFTGDGLDDMIYRNSLHGGRAVLLENTSR